MDPRQGKAAAALFWLHTVLELVLGLVKLPGTYSGLEMPLEAAKFARHHGISLLALALLGGLTASRGLISTPTGQLVSTCLAFFHAGATTVMLHAANFKIVLLHAPFAVGFAWHAAAAKKTS